MKAVVIFTIVMLLFIGCILYFFVIPYTPWSNHVVPLSRILPQSEKPVQQPQEESELGEWITLIMIGSGLGTLGGSPHCATVFLICCLVLLFIDYHWILVGALFAFVILPTVFVGFLGSLFKRD